MTKEEIFNMSNYLIFKDNSFMFPRGHLKDYIDFALKHLNDNDSDRGLVVLDSNIPEDRYVNDSPSNFHHYTTDFHYNIVFPVICKLLNLTGINLNDDFYLIKKQVGNSYFSYLFPKVDEYDFSIRYMEISSDELGIIGKPKTAKGKFSVLMGSNLNPYFREFETDYHTLFSSAHFPCIITNETINDSKTLLISGSSHNIPTLPLLAYYFKKIVFLDNRDKISYKWMWEEEKFTHSLICMHNKQDQPLEKFVESNFF